MKRLKKKLVLDSKTIRKLTQQDLVDVTGGGDTQPTGSGRPGCVTWDK